MARTNMAGQPGAALRGLRADFVRALDRRVEGVLERAAVALPVAAGFPLVVLPLPFLLSGGPGWALWCMPVLGACLCGHAALAWLRRPAAADDGARTPDGILDDLAAGADSEETIGMAVEWALTRSDCAVAHNVADIPGTKPDVDHLVATLEREPGCGSNLPCRSRGTSRSIAPESVSTRLRWLPSSCSPSRSRCGLHLRRVLAG